MLPCLQRMNDGLQRDLRKAQVKLRHAEDAQKLQEKMREESLQKPQMAEKGVSPASEAAQEGGVQAENTATTAEARVRMSMEFLTSPQYEKGP